jgi:predicted anti-sigma-YlaC factor YlaD
MDDEPIGMSAAVLDHHLATCPECARWVDEATHATRLARLDVTPVPDLADAIMVNIALPARRVQRRRFALRAGLLLAGLVQLVIGLTGCTGDSIGMAMSAHATHEMAAWNLAIGAAFIAAASIPRRAAGLIPLLGTFLVILGALSVHDYITGAVTIARLATHVAALIGLLLLIGLDRSEQAQPPRRQAAEARDDAGSTDLRTVA